MKNIHIVSATSSSLTQWVYGFTDKKLANEVAEHIRGSMTHSVLVFENLELINHDNVEEMIPRFELKRPVKEKV